MSASAPSSDQSTPSSERTVYFDAPIMHIFSKDDSHDSGYVPPPPKDGGGRSSMSYDYSSGQAAPRHPASVPQDTTADTQGPRGKHGGDGAGGQDVRAADYAAHDARGTQQPQGPGSAAEQSDSGYGSSSPPPPARQRAVSADRASLEPVPVVWAGADGGQPHGGRARERDEDEGDVRRSQSLRSLRRGRVEREREGSVRTTPSGRRTPRRNMSVSGGSFAQGPGMTGPNAYPEDDETSVFRARSVYADAGLSKKQRSRISKEERKEGKLVVKVMKQEAKAEKKALEVTMKELADIQRMQKNAIKEEAKTNASHAHALRVFHKEEVEYLSARAKYERAQADLQVYEDAREASREHAREATEMLQEKNREVEWLRAQKAADDREREAKIRQLTGKAS